MIIPDSEGGSPLLAEATRELEAAIHDARVAFDCIGLGEIDRAHTSALTARTAIDAAVTAVQAALVQAASQHAGQSAASEAAVSEAAVSEAAVSEAAVSEATSRPPARPLPAGRRPRKLVKSGTSGAEAVPMPSA